MCVTFLAATPVWLLMRGCPWCFNHWWWEAVFTRLLQLLTHISTGDRQLQEYKSWLLEEMNYSANMLENMGKIGEILLCDSCWEGASDVLITTEEAVYTRLLQLLTQVSTGDRQLQKYKRWLLEDMSYGANILENMGKIGVMNTFLFFSKSNWLYYWQYCP